MSQTSLSRLLQRCGRRTLDCTLRHQALLLLLTDRPLQIAQRAVPVHLTETASPRTHPTLPIARRSHSTRQIYLDEARAHFAFRSVAVRAVLLIAPAYTRGAAATRVGGRRVERGRFVLEERSQVAYCGGGAIFGGHGCSRDKRVSQPRFDAGIQRVEIGFSKLQCGRGLHSLPPTAVIVVQGNGCCWSSDAVDRETRMLAGAGVSCLRAACCVAAGFRGGGGRMCRAYGALRLAKTPEPCNPPHSSEKKTGVLTTISEEQNERHHTARRWAGTRNSKDCDCERTR